MQEPEKNKSNYTKLSIGKNRLRIVSKDDIRGWECWADIEGKRKPIRQIDRFHARQLADMGVEDKKQKKFHAFIVWNYADEVFQCWEVTQSTIIDALWVYFSDENWGSLTDYDIVIDRQGEGMLTKYSVVPNPHKPFEGEIPEYDLGLLFTGGHPLGEI